MVYKVLEELLSYRILAHIIPAVIPKPHIREVILSFIAIASKHINPIRSPPAVYISTANRTIKFDPGSICPAGYCSSMIIFLLNYFPHTSFPPFFRITTTGTPWVPPSTTQKLLNLEMSGLGTSTRKVRQLAVEHVGDVELG